MKIIYTIIFFLSTHFVFGQRWTQSQLDSANTVSNIESLTDQEKTVILSLNLARMYPKQFIKNELKFKDLGIVYKFRPSDEGYLKSLIIHLETMVPKKPLQFNHKMQELSECFSQELGDSGRSGHVRTVCPDGNYFGECVSYNYGMGIDIALQLLLDCGVPTLGHRRVCLDNKYEYIGVSISNHSRYYKCSVLDFTNTRLLQMLN